MVNKETLWRGNRKKKGVDDESARHVEKREKERGKDQPAFEGGKLVLFYLGEARVLERTGKGVLGDPLVKGEGIEVADAPP